MPIYFDNAATTKISDEVLEAMMPFLTENYGNPSSIHALGRRTKSAIEKSRKIVANVLNVSPSEITFTSGGTESNNFAINNAIQKLGVKRIISSPIEHHCVKHTVEHFQKTNQVEVAYVKLKECGHVDLEHLEKLLDSDKTTLVSLMHANNEIGNILDLETVSGLCEHYKAYLHTDTVQTFGHYPIDLQKIKVHYLSGSAHKFHGPKGIGIIYCNGEVETDPLIYGGSQERNRRAGTENLYGIVGLGKAVEIAYNNLSDDKNYILSLKNYFIEQINSNFTDISYNGDCINDALYTLVNINFTKNVNSSLIMLNLDVEGICVSGGSACSSGSNTGSHVLNTIKKANEDNSNSIRFSFSKYNTKSEIDSAIKVLSKILNKEPSIAG